MAHDLPDLAIAVILGVVEGATEFLPVSSTGHLIVASKLLGFDDARTSTFEIFIQLGAILAVVWDRRATLRGVAIPLPRLAQLLFAGFLPSALLGLAAHDWIEAHLFHPSVVAWALILGAGAILVIERARPRARLEQLASLTATDAALIGLMQCAAFVPGVSRAAATILGGMLLGLSRPLATEFSFLLAIPTIGAASLYSLATSKAPLGLADAPFFATGLAVSFVVALVVVRWLIGYVQRHDFRPFALWRVAVGVAVLGLMGGR